MAENYYSILTSIGKAQIANALSLGTKIDFVKMKVGDGNGNYYNPTESQVDLVHTVWEGAIGHVAIDEENPNWINIEVLIPPDVGGFMIREYGVFDANNNMLGIAKCPETYKPLPSDGSTKELNMKFVLAVTNTTSVTLKIDPTILFAKKKDVDVVQNQVTSIATEIQNARKGKETLKEKIDEIDSSLSDMMYQTAGGIATALILTIKGTLVTGYPITFIASANNGGATTTINGKKLYKPATTNAPTLIKDKAYTVWYNAAGDNGNGCFFIKASATGTALASQVLKDVPFSNENETDLVGTIPSKAAATYTPGTTDQIIEANQYLSGVQTIKGDVNFVAANIKKGITAFDVTGTYDPLTAISGTSISLFYKNNLGAISTSYYLCASAICKNQGGVCTISFGLACGGTNAYAYARIYINGVARGIERSAYGQTIVTFTEDFVLNVDDVVQLYGKAASGYACSLTNFKITCGNNYITFV